MTPGPVEVPDDVLDVHVAAVAAETTRLVAGVTRLQPGFWGLVHQLGRELWERVTGSPYPDVAGVEVVLGADGALIDVGIVTDGRRPATAVVAQVAEAVAEAVTGKLGVEVAGVAVHVCAIDLPG
ncbi:MAG: Asp23/Gls24 family envelope stress response protein [Pseudonocardia sp.]